MKHEIIDNQIETFPIYASDFQISFIDAFRDFTIDLSRDGMESAIISNYNDTRIKITLIGSSTVQRTLNFNGNIDIQVSQQNYEYITFNLDEKAKLNVVNSKSLLLESKENMLSDKKEETIPMQIALAVSSMLFVVGLMIVFFIDRIFLSNKDQDNTNEVSTLLQ